MRRTLRFMSWLQRLFSGQALPTSGTDGKTASGLPDVGLPTDARTCSVRIPLHDGGELPEWIRIVPLGDFPNHHNGAHSVTRQHLEEMVANFSRLSTDLLFDYDHGSAFGGSTRAAGWSPELQVRADGLYARRPEWTPPAAEAIANPEYRYLSPVYILESEDKAGNPAGAWLHSVAITSAPYFNEGEVAAIGNRNTGNPSSANEKTEEPFMEREELIALLGLPTDATDEQIKAKRAAIERAAERPEGPEGPEGGEDDDPEGAAMAEADPPEEGEDVTAELAGEAAEGLEAKVNSLIARFDAQDEADAQARAETLVSSAVEQGKIQPTERAAYLSWAGGDYKACKKELDGRKAGRSLPGKVEVSGDGAPRPTTRFGASRSSKAMEYVNQTAR